MPAHTHRHKRRYVAPMMSTLTSCSCKNDPCAINSGLCCLMTGSTKGVLDGRLGSDEELPRPCRQPGIDSRQMIKGALDSILSREDVTDTRSLSNGGRGGTLAQGHC